MNQKLLLLFLLTIPINLFGQICKGTVINKETKAPVKYANVFLNASLIGTITNEKGMFELDLNGNFSFPLIVSHVGYESVVVEPENLSSDLKIVLKKKVIEIDNVNVKPEPSSWSRKKMIRIFKNEFVGSSKLARTCEITNIDDVYLYYNKRPRFYTRARKCQLLFEIKCWLTMCFLCWIILNGAKKH